MVVMKKEYTPATLAPALHVSVDAFRKAWPEFYPDESFDRNRILNGTTAKWVNRFKDSPRATDQTRTAAAAILSRIDPAPVPETRPENKPTPTPVPGDETSPVPSPVTPVPDRPSQNAGKPARRKRYQKTEVAPEAGKPERGVRVPGLLIGVVLAPALIWQIEHYSHVVDAFSRIENPVTSYVFSLFFSFSVTGTAIVMTAAKGKLSYLYIFAGIETVTNILYCDPVTWTDWVTTVLISGAMAFTIFSYSEILTNISKNRG